MLDNFSTFLVHTAGWPCNKHIEVADRFAAASQRTRWTDLIDALDFLKVVDKFFRKFLGRVDHEQMPAVYAAHHMLVFTSTRSEGMPMVMMEAMCAGCAVPNTGSGGAIELSDRAAAPLFPKDHTFALSRLLTSVTVTPGGVGVSETGVAALLVGWGANPAQATAGVVLYSLYVHFLEVPLGALGWLAWWLGPKVDTTRTTDPSPADATSTGSTQAQSQPASSSVTKGTKT